MPKFNRISLVGSEELFRPTRVDSDDETTAPVEAAPADSLAGHAGSSPAPNPTYPPPAPLSRQRALYRLQLTESQIKTLLEAVQRMKYPEHVHAGSKPSIEEFEALEQVRNTLFNALD